MKDHFYFISFTDEPVPHIVFAKNDQEAIEIALTKKKEGTIEGKIEAKEYLKNEKRYQQMFTDKIARRNTK